MGKRITVSDAELEILEVLWSAGEPLNANEIRARLNENKKWERTTVLTLIKRLTQKGILRQEKRAVYYYEPCIGREDYVQEETRNFVDKYFEGNCRSLAAALVSSKDLTKEDIEELRSYFNQNMPR